ncbi:MAG: RluA family pseudouridine synthase [Spirochaetes bacterium]|nr:RluA family pseudouridine synthase [Spirochaetota bacterium]
MIMQEKTTLSSVINRNNDGISLIDFLSSRFKYHTVDTWKEIIRRIDIKVNGHASSPDYILQYKDIVTYSVILNEPRVDTNIKIIHNEDSFLVAFKPGNLPSHADGNFIKNTFIYIIKKMMSAEGYNDYLKLAHRLDRETSGLIVVAKSKDANRALARQFESGAIEKEYIAVVRGIIPDDSFAVDGHIAPDPESSVSIRKRVVPAGTPGAQPALTSFEVIERLKNYTVVRCLPETGRTNQIRVHLAHSGHPLAGDKLYGRSDDEFLEFVRAARAGKHDPLPWMDAPRHMLHASKIAFKNPATNEKLSFQSPIPDDMYAFIKKVSS